MQWHAFLPCLLHLCIFNVVVHCFDIFVFIGQSPVHHLFRREVKWEQLCLPLSRQSPWNQRLWPLRYEMIIPLSSSVYSSSVSCLKYLASALWRETQCHFQTSYCVFASDLYSCATWNVQVWVYFYISYKLVICLMFECISWPVTEYLDEVMFKMVFHFYYICLIVFFSLNWRLLCCWLDVSAWYSECSWLAWCCLYLLT